MRTKNSNVSAPVDFFFSLLKSFLFTISLFYFVAYAQNGKIEESFYVFDQYDHYRKVLERNDSIIVDHVTENGFEVYGPKGLKKYLNLINARYESLAVVEALNKLSAKSYPTYEEVVSRLKKIVEKNSSIMTLFSIGKTVEGRDLWVVKVSDNVRVDEIEPEFKYISSMHGDEIVGRELLQNFLEDLGDQYQKNETVKKMIDETEIFILASMNPDGSLKIQRGNGNGVDLNRNFPNILTSNPQPPTNQGGNRGWQPRRNSNNKADKFEPETLAIMNWHKVRKFSMSANFHGGAVVMNYMWDSKSDRHPLDEFLQEIALVYADLNPTMKSSSAFDRGITNGADWYIVKGGMQDYAYLFYNDLQYTIELSQVKYPDFNQIPNFYKENKDSLFSFLKQVQRGKGFVWKGQSGYVEVVEKSKNKKLGVFQYSDEFYKVLPEGDYQYKILDRNSNLKKILEVSVDDRLSFGQKYQIL